MWMNYEDCLTYPEIFIIFTLRLREQVREGTRLIWLICKAAQPILNIAANVM